MNPNPKPSPNPPTLIQIVEQIALDVAEMRVDIAGIRDAIGVPSQAKLNQLSQALTDVTAKIEEFDKGIPGPPPEAQPAAEQ